MLRIIVAICSLYFMPLAAQGKIVFIGNSEQLLKIPVGVTAKLEGPREDGWFLRTAYFKAPGDGLKGDPGFYMTPLTAREQEQLTEAQGVYTCYRRDKAKATKGKFKFGRNDAGTLWGSVQRQRQLKKGLSKDAKILVEAGKVIAAVVALYTGNPQTYVKGSKGWEQLIGKVHETTDFSQRMDMTPTVVENRQERWNAEGKFTITVKRYYNCWITMRLRLR